VSAHNPTSVACNAATLLVQLFKDNFSKARFFCFGFLVLLIVFVISHYWVVIIFLLVFCFSYR